MNNLEKIADLLVEQHKPYVNGYVGSSMLTNTEYPEQITRSATRCAIQSVNHTIETLQRLDVNTSNAILEVSDAIAEQLELKKILEGRL